MEKPSNDLESGRVEVIPPSTRKLSARAPIEAMRLHIDSIDLTVQGLLAHWNDEFAPEVEKRCVEKRKQGAKFQRLTLLLSGLIATANVALASRVFQDEGALAGWGDWVALTAAILAVVATGLASWRGFVRASELANGYQRLAADARQLSRRFASRWDNEVAFPSKFDVPEAHAAAVRLGNDAEKAHEGLQHELIAITEMTGQSSSNLPGPRPGVS